MICHVCVRVVHLFLSPLLTPRDINARAARRKVTQHWTKGTCRPVRVRAWKMFRFFCKCGLGLRVESRPLLFAGYRSRQCDTSSNHSLRLVLRAIVCCWASHGRPIYRAAFGGLTVIVLTQLKLSATNSRPPLYRALKYSSRCCYCSLGDEF